MPATPSMNRSQRGVPPRVPPEHAHYREHAVDQGVGAEQRDQCLHGDPRPQERGQPEEYGDGAAQGQSPPVPGLRRQRRLWMGHAFLLFRGRHPGITGADTPLSDTLYARTL